MWGDKRLLESLTLWHDRSERLENKIPESTRSHWHSYERSKSLSPVSAGFLTDPRGRGPPVRTLALPNPPVVDVHEPDAKELQPDRVLQDLFDQGRLVGEAARN